MKTISITVPCYNEEGNILKFYNEIKQIIIKERNVTLNSLFALKKLFKLSLITILISPNLIYYRILI